MTPISADTIFSTPAVRREEECTQDVIRLAVEDNFQRVCQTPTFSLTSSLFKKKQPEETDYFFGGFSFLELLEKMKHNGKIQNLLEIGCGSGKVLKTILHHFTGFFKVVGVDAKIPTLLKESQYVIGNAETLCEIPSLEDQRFKVIFSRATFRHFIDPLQAVLQAYEKLSVDGVLLIDQVIFPGLNGFEGSILFWLNSNGYLAFADISSGSGVFNSFIIVKTKDHLELPIKYHSERPLRLGYAYYETKGPIKKEPTQSLERVQFMKKTVFA